MFPRIGFNKLFAKPPTITLSPLRKVGDPISTALLIDIFVKRIYVSLIIRCILLIKLEVYTFCIHKDGVMSIRELQRLRLRSCSLLPNYLIHKMIHPKNLIKYRTQQMNLMPVTVQINTPRFSQKFPHQN